MNWFKEMLTHIILSNPNIKLLKDELKIIYLDLFDIDDPYVFEYEYEDEKTKEKKTKTEIIYFNDLLSFVAKISILDQVQRLTAPLNNPSFQTIKDIISASTIFAIKYHADFLVTLDEFRFFWLKDIKGLKTAEANHLTKINYQPFNTDNTVLPKLFHKYCTNDMLENILAETRDHFCKQGLLEIIFPETLVKLFKKTILSKYNNWKYINSDLSIMMNFINEWNSIYDYFIIMHHLRKEQGNKFDKDIFKFLAEISQALNIKLVHESNLLRLKIRLVAQLIGVYIPDLETKLKKYPNQGAQKFLKYLKSINLNRFTDEDLATLMKSMEKFYNNINEMIELSQQQTTNNNNIESPSSMFSSLSLNTASKYAFSLFNTKTPETKKSTKTTKEIDDDWEMPDISSLSTNDKDKDVNDGWEEIPASSATPAEEITEGWGVPNIFRNS